MKRSEILQMVANINNKNNNNQHMIVQNMIWKISKAVNECGMPYVIISTQKIKGKGK